MISPKVFNASGLSIIFGEFIDFNNSPTDSLSYESWSEEMISLLASKVISYPLSKV